MEILCANCGLNCTETAPYRPSPVYIKLGLYPRRSMASKPFESCKHSIPGTRGTTGNLKVLEPSYTLHWESGGLPLCFNLRLKGQNLSCQAWCLNAEYYFLVLQLIFKMHLQNGPTEVMISLLLIPLIKTAPRFLLALAEENTGASRLSKLKATGEGAIWGRRGSSEKHLLEHAAHNHLIPPFPFTSGCFLQLDCSWETHCWRIQSQISNIMRSWPIAYYLLHSLWMIMPYFPKMTPRQPKK